jgi:putative copper export protein
MPAMWELLRWLHLLAMAFFVGGQMMLAAVVVPALRGGDRTSLRAMARRFGTGSLVALAVLLATGIPMAGHLGDWDRGVLQVKLALVVLAGALIGWHTRRPERHAIEGAVFLVSLAIVWLGVALAH